MERNFDMRVEIKDSVATVIIYDVESGIQKEIVYENLEQFGKDLGEEMYSWISLMEDC